ncbi:MAG: glutamate 5-kinase [bacterium]
MSHRQIVKKAKTWVVKIGSSILTDEKGALDPKVFKALTSDVASLVHAGKRVVLVSSGAIACGMHKLGFEKKPHLIPQKQAVAAAGQITLMNYYDKAFAREKLGIAQLLLTRGDLSDRGRYMNARHAIHEMLGFGLVPIINENDTVAVEEIKFGDNDNLSALVTNVVEADLLVILSDIEGVYTANPQLDPSATKIALIEDIDDRCHALAQDTLRAGSTGGMITKLQAAEKASHFGVATVIASGRSKGILSRLAAGEEEGTLILPKDASARLNRRKHWIAYTLKPMGQLVVDAGAKGVILEKGKSLLSSGIRQVMGIFENGDPVDLLVEGEKPFARGLVGYSSHEIEKIKGAKTIEIEARLGYKYLDEVIHRDDLVVL